MPERSLWVSRLHLGCVFHAPVNADMVYLMRYYQTSGRVRLDPTLTRLRALPHRSFYPRHSTWQDVCRSGTLRAYSNESHDADLLIVKGLGSRPRKLWTVAGGGEVLHRVVRTIL